MPDSPLLQALAQRHALLDGEDALLRMPETLALPPGAQLDYLRQNRAVGRFVTGLAGGVRLLVLGGGAIAMVQAAIDGAIPVAWWSLAIWIALVGAVVWLSPQFFRRMRELGRPLPTLDELGLSPRARE